MEYQINSVSAWLLSAIPFLRATSNFAKSVNTIYLNPFDTHWDFETIPNTLLYDIFDGRPLHLIASVGLKIHCYKSTQWSHCNINDKWENVHFTVVRQWQQQNEKRHRPTKPNQTKQKQPGNTALYYSLVRMVNVANIRTF